MSIFTTLGLILVIAGSLNAIFPTEAHRALQRKPHKIFLIGPMVSVKAIRLSGYVAICGGLALIATGIFRAE